MKSYCNHNGRRLGLGEVRGCRRSSKKIREVEKRGRRGV